LKEDRPPPSPRVEMKDSPFLQTGFAPFEGLEFALSLILGACILYALISLRCLSGPFRRRPSPSGNFLSRRDFYADASFSQHVFGGFIPAQIRLLPFPPKDSFPSQVLPPYPTYEGSFCLLHFTNGFLTTRSVF